MDSLDAYLTVLGREGWAGATPEAAAAEAGVKPSQVLADVGDRWDVLKAWQRRIDRYSLAEADSAIGHGSREKLFELMMARFDALSHHRPAALALMRAARRDPGLATWFAGQLPIEVRRLCEAAGIDTAGWFGIGRIVAVTAAYVQLAQVWAKDDEPDMSRTMRALDAALGRLQGLRVVSGAARPSPAAALDPLAE